MEVQTWVAAFSAFVTTATGFFLVRFVRVVDQMQKRQVEMDREYHSRLSVLEAKNGVYNQHTFK